MHQKIALSGYVFLMIHLLYLFALNPMRPYSYKKMQEKHTYSYSISPLFFGFPRHNYGSLILWS